MANLSDFSTLPTRDAKVPSLGRITMGNGNRRSLRLAAEASSDVPREEVPIVFANALLAEMVIEPKLTLPDVANLPDVSLQPMATCAADLLGLPDLNQAIDKQQAPRRALHDAVLEQEQQMYEKLKPVLGLSVSPVQSAIDAMPEWTSDLSRVANAGIDPIAKFADSSIVLSGIYLDGLRISDGILDNIPSSILDKVGVSLADVGIASTALLGIDQIPDTSLAPSAFTEITSLADSLSAAAGTAALPETLVPRGLHLMGLEPASIHTPTYREPEPILIEDWEDQEEAEQQERQQRRVRCQDILFELERSLRWFVETELSAAFGSRWWRQRVHNDIRTKCATLKAEREKDGGVVNSDIHYTYLGQLGDIILQNSNWNNVFRQHFLSDVAFRAMLEFTLVVRNDVDHARYSSDSDYIEFMVATNWFYRRMGLAEPFTLTDQS